MTTIERVTEFTATVAALRNRIGERGLDQVIRTVVRDGHPIQISVNADGQAQILTLGSVEAAERGFRNGEEVVSVPLLEAWHAELRTGR